MSSKVAVSALVSLLALSAAGCGSTHPAALATTTTTAPSATPFASLQRCLQRSGYAVAPESPAALHTAPSRFEFTAVWNLLNPSRVALAVTFSRNTTGAKEAAAWTRATNAKMGRGLVPAPVARIGKIDVLWTAKPGPASTKDVYGCIRRQR